MHKSVNETDVLSLNATYRHLDRLFTVFGEVDDIKVLHFLSVGQWQSYRGRYLNQICCISDTQEGSCIHVLLYSCYNVDKFYKLLVCFGVFQFQSITHERIIEID